MSSTEIISRPAYRPYRATVSRVRRLSPHFVRVTFHDHDLAYFGTAGLDQRIKVVLPRADGEYGDFGQHDAAGDWYDRWRALPESERNPFRTYTVRRIDPDARELDVDFVVHPGAGPAGTWAETAAPGQELIIVGPDERSPHSATGLDWHPGNATRLLLAGDETAAPAIGAILESLDDSHEVDAFIEVATAEDVVPPACASGFRVHWIARHERAHGAALIEAVSAWASRSTDVLERAAAPRTQELDDIDVDRELLWDSPEGAEGEFYAWIAGEAATVKQLRRMLVSDRGVDRKRVAFMGYWRLGQAERVE
ncbi:siderophore-interacting protein [Microbacterium rhizomatis]|uniref:Siderophore-interacting protein n=1 Tax=Microbacterium rhizomatis TaxID=1631477 RepID=A0A5J5J450_9MICO|nr:siderophore-interacting protein [Microbacterium rhizomatis]KAA9110841.1 siderophore-interacting protein [Microbacterium rhizomatis]